MYAGLCQDRADAIGIGDVLGTAKSKQKIFHRVLELQARAHPIGARALIALTFHVNLWHEPRNIRIAKR